MKLEIKTILNTHSVRYLILFHKQFSMDISLPTFCSNSMANLLCQQFRLEHSDFLNMFKSSDSKPIVNKVISERASRRNG